MEFTLQTMELFKIVDRAYESGFNRGMEKCGKLSPYMKKQECYTVACRRAVDRALKEGNIKTVLKGTRIYVLRESFDKWIYKHELVETGKL
jgi:hypothetical protein